LAGFAADLCRIVNTRQVPPAARFVWSTSADQTSGNYVTNSSLWTVDIDGRARMAFSDCDAIDACESNIGLWDLSISPDGQLAMYERVNRVGQCATWMPRLRAIDGGQNVPLSGLPVNDDQHLYEYSQAHWTSGGSFALDLRQSANLGDGCTVQVDSTQRRFTCDVRTGCTETSLDITLTNDRGDAVHFDVRSADDRSISEIRWTDGSITEMTDLADAAWSPPAP
jgi:hypothetical protein